MKMMGVLDPSYDGHRLAAICMRQYFILPIMTELFDGASGRKCGHRIILLCFMLQLPLTLVQKLQQNWHAKATWREHEN